MKKVERRELAKRVEKASLALEEAYAHCRDAKKQEKELARIIELHDQKSAIIRRFSEERSADVWDIAGKQIAILERDLVLGEIDPEALAYQSIAGKSQENRLVAREKESLKNLLINLKMFYFLLKEELMNLRKADKETLIKGLDSQDGYLKKAALLSKEDLRLTNEERGIFMKMLKEELKALFSIKGLYDDIPVFNKNEPIDKVHSAMSSSNLSSVVIKDSKTYRLYTMIDAIKGKGLKDSKELYGVSRKVSLDEALDSLLKNGLSEIYIIDKVPIGVIRDVDFLNDFLVASIIEDGIERNANSKDTEKLCLSDMKKDDLLSVQRNSDDSEVLKLLLAFNRPVLVKDKGSLVGFITLERYFNEVVIRKKRDALAGELMQSPVYSAQKDTPLIEVILLMLSMGCMVIEVKDGRKSIGAFWARERLNKELQNIKKAKALMEKGVKVTAILLASKIPESGISPTIVRMRYPPYSE